MEKAWVWIGVPVVLIGLCVLLLALNPGGGGGGPGGDNTLNITDVKEGTGREAKTGDFVIVHYTGTLRNGIKFDSSLDREEPFSFQLGQGGVIKGWDQGVVGMKEGGIRKLEIPPHLGYGSKGAGKTIPPNSELLFEIQLLKVKGLAD